MIGHLGHAAHQEFCAVRRGNKTRSPLTGDLREIAAEAPCKRRVKIGLRLVNEKQAVRETEHRNDESRVDLDPVAETTEVGRRRGGRR